MLRKLHELKLLALDVEYTRAHEAGDAAAKKDVASPQARAARLLPLTLRLKPHRRRKN
jgi:hypothetical protein